MNIKIFGEGLSRVGIRQITPQIYWICHCIGKGADKINGGFAADFAKANPLLDPEAGDIIYSSYLFLDKKTFLIDTLAPSQHDTILEALDHLLDGRKLDYLWISHTELPHAGNTAALCRAHPEVEILTVGGHDHYEIHGLGNARKLEHGDRLDLGEHKIEIIEPIFVDHALTQWVYEHKTGFLCPVDWALNVHNEHQCFRFMDEMEEVGYSAEQFMEEVSTTNRVVFAWLRWADPDEMVAAIDRFYENYDIKIFAPSHTQVIRKDLPKYMGALRQAMHKAITGHFDVIY
jgi:flavorubredoxin